MLSIRAMRKNAADDCSDKSDECKDDGEVHVVYASNDSRSRVRYVTLRIGICKVAHHSYDAHHCAKYQTPERTLHCTQF
jgi:hypothetical protein